MLVLALVDMLLAACAPTREWDAALLLADIAAGEGASRLKETTPPPTRETVICPADPHTCSGDLYLPGEKARAAILLLPGAAEEGKDDPRLRAFATSLARASFAVLVPDLKRFRSLEVGSADVADVVAVFRWLSSQSRLAPAGRAGICAFSYAAGPAFLAALHPQSQGRVRFVVSVGGYHSLVNVLRYFTTGYFQAGEEWRYREPNRYGMWVFVAANAERLQNPEDRRILLAAANRKLGNIDAPVDDLLPRLGAEGKRVVQFILNRDPAKVPHLVECLPDGIRNEIEALDLARADLETYPGIAIILHGLDDDIIPYTESISLSRSLPAGHSQLFLLHGLMHVELRLRLQDTFRLWRALSVLLEQREGR